VRIGHAVGAAFTDRRVLGPVEASLTASAGAAACVLALIFVLFPRVLAYPFSALAAWAGLALIYRGYRLWRERRRTTRTSRQPESDSPGR
jgi:cardiolipin synthase